MQIEVIYYPIEDGRVTGELKSKTMSGFGKNAVQSVEKQISLSGEVKIIGTVMHNPETKVMKISNGRSGPKRIPVC